MYFHLNTMKYTNKYKLYSKKNFDKPKITYKIFNINQKITCNTKQIHITHIQTITDSHKTHPNTLDINTCIPSGLVVNISQIKKNAKEKPQKIT